MADEPWQPLSVRETGSAVFREGVPDILAAPLARWLEAVTEGRPDLVHLLLRRLGGNPADDWQFMSEDQREEIRAEMAFNSSGEELLDAVDAALDVLPDKASAKVAAISDGIGIENERKARRGPLQQLLDDTRSVYCIKDDGRGLERRSPALATSLLTDAELAARARAEAGSAAAQLRAASDEVRSLKPDPEKAYSQAIKAVESAAHFVVEPARPKATLGTMLGHLRSQPHMFEVAIPGPDRSGSVTPVTGLMTLLWEGQTSRHGGQLPTRPETREEAEMAVQIASLLVLWFTTGVVRQKQ